MIKWTPEITWERLEAAWIKDALEAHDGNKTHTAKATGMSLRTLRNKIRKYPELVQYIELKYPTVAERAGK